MEPRVPTDLLIRCSCGALRGVARGVSAGNGNRIVCYCDDCQSFAHFLGRPDEILDAHGGTDVFQMSPAGVEITDGGERLACMRLAPKGLLRWYSECCRTPIGNTLATHRIPFVGLIHSCLDPSDGRPLDATLGPVRVRVHARFAKGGRPQQQAHDRVPVSEILRVAGRLLVWRLRGDHRHSPFFDAASGRPSATPRVLSAAELRAVRAETILQI
jgi:Family of unknown function (DUF6151)